MLTEAKVKIARTIDNRIKKSIETFVLDCEFFAQAEYTVMQILQPDMEENGGPIHEAEVLQIRRSTLKEIATQYQGGRSFIATLIDLWVDDNGNEKKLRYKVLLWAEDLSEATDRARQLQREGYDMLIEGVKEVNYTYIPNVQDNFAPRDNNATAQTQD